jgi:hypothetical protein
MVFLAAFVFPVAADVELSHVSWETIGTQVRFHLQFHNPDQLNPSGAVSGELHSQPFGAFVPNNGLITPFNVPPMAPDSFFDIFTEIELSSLPPSADRLTPGSGGGGGGGSLLSTAQGCPPDLFWAGNVDVFWNGPGGSGQANAHYGTLQICPGGQSSYIHIFGDCQDPAGTFWSFGPLCPGWSATLVSSDGMGLPGGPAPNPLPVGFFDGWICISADASVPIGATCCFDLFMTCGASTVPIHMCTEACIWEPVSTEPSTWGKIKSLYQE